MNIEKWFEEGISAQGVAMISALLSAAFMIVWNVVKRIYTRLTRPEEFVAYLLDLMKDVEQWQAVSNELYRHKTKPISFVLSYRLKQLQAIRVREHILDSVGLLDGMRLRRAALRIQEGLKELESQLKRKEFLSAVQSLKDQ